MVRIRLIDDHNLRIIEEWWRKNDSQLIPRPLLPQNGVMLEVEEQPTCSAWFYKTDSKVGVMAFVCVNPDSNKTDRNTALNFLAEHASLIAKPMGIDFIYCPIRSVGFCARLLKFGWVKTDDGHWKWS